MIYQTIQEDFKNILTYINDMSRSLGISDVQVDLPSLMKVCVEMRREFPHTDGIEMASVFKKTANFLAYFLAYQPIRSKFPENTIAEVKDVDPNAMVAFDIALLCIENSTIKFKDGTTKTIDTPIFMSNHSYTDIICALTKDEDIKPTSHYHIYSVFLEQLTYKTNPECQYDYKCKNAPNYSNTKEHPAAETLETGYSYYPDSGFI